MTDGFLLVDKDGGWTSHDVVAKIRRLFGQKKVGHAGTLDPMATGLVVVGLGRATRLLRFVQALTKEYVATAVLGIATDTLDADGDETSRVPMPVDRADIERVLPGFVGNIEQIPPMVSAIKIDGRRLHELAREGKEIERPPRPVRIDSITIEDFDDGQHPQVTMRVRCGTGTYVRTLADDIAGALGGRAHLSALRRVSNGSLLVESAFTIADLEARHGAGSLEATVLPPADGLRDLPFTTIGEAEAVRARNGGSVELDAEHSASPIRLLDTQGGLIGIYRVEGTQARPEVVVS